MKLIRCIIAAALCLGLLVCAAGAEEITADALRKALDENVFINLFDVRSQSEYEAGAIPGAASLPLDQLEGSMRATLDGGFSNMGIDVYLYGATAEDSASAAKIMADLGFTNVHYLPGIGAWAEPLLAPDLMLGGLDAEDVYGRHVDQSLIADQKLVMVNVWATYCNPCISEMQGLGILSRELKDQGVMILGILSDCTNADMTLIDKNVETARLIAETTKADYTHLLPSRAIFRDVIAQVTAVPTTFFVDGQGRLVGQVYLGARDENAWREIIKSTLAELEQAGR